MPFFRVNITGYLATSTSDSSFLSIYLFIWIERESDCLSYNNSQFKGNKNDSFESFSKPIILPK